MTFSGGKKGLGPLNIRILSRITLSSPRTLRAALKLLNKATRTKRSPQHKMRVKPEQPPEVEALHGFPEQSGQPTERLTVAGSRGSSSCFVPTLEMSSTSEHRLPPENTLV